MSFGKEIARIIGDTHDRSYGEGRRSVAGTVKQMIDEKKPFNYQDLEGLAEQLALLERIEAYVNEVTGGR